MAVPFVIGMGFLLLGVVLLVLWRLGGHERFFGRRPFEAVDPAVARRENRMSSTDRYDLQQAAKDHLWMHFTRMGGYQARTSRSSSAATGATSRT